MVELIIKNCNGETVGYNFKNEVELVYKFDTIGFENEIPMLDDEVIKVKIDSIEVDNGNIEIVNDLYELTWEKLLSARSK